MKFYYIFKDLKVKVKNEEVNVNLFPQFVPMTEEQINFYLENPTASINEIKRCELYPQPQEPTLEEVKENAINRISDYSLKTNDKIIPNYKSQNATNSLISVLLGNPTDVIYTLNDSKNLLKKSIKIGKQCRDLFYKQKELIEKAETKENVSNIIQETILLYDIILEENNVNTINN